MPDLFCAVPFSYGTLGFLTAVEIDIIPYKPYIELNYHPVRTLEEAVKVFKHETVVKNNDSVEGIMFSLNKGVIMSGNFIDSYKSGNGVLNRIGLWFKPWFYKHVETFQDEPEIQTEVILTYDFFHRHNRSCFWMISYLIPFGNHPIFRYLLGWMLPPRHAMIKLLKENFVPDGKINNFVCQDFGIRIEDLRPLMEVVDEETKVYPLWLCPTRHVVPEGLESLNFFRKDDLHIDVGVYGYMSKNVKLT